jgi:hypothetical protein
MPSLLDRRAAFVARKAGTLVDPHELVMLQGEMGATLPAFAIEADEPARVANDLA